MAFDETLAGRIRGCLVRRKNVEEQKMFAGVAVDVLVFEGTQGVIAAKVIWNAAYKYSGRYTPLLKVAAGVGLPAASSMPARNIRSKPPKKALPLENATL